MGYQLMMIVAILFIVCVSCAIGSQVDDEKALFTYKRKGVNVDITDTTIPMCNDKLRTKMLNIKKIALKSTSNPDDIVLIHSFPFNAEPMSFLTIAYLYDSVDYFIVVESLETFAGTFRQKYHLDEHSGVLERYKDKLIQVRINRFPTKSFDLDYCKKRGDCALCWCREAYIRDIVKHTVTKQFANKKYILVHSDGDELPKVNVFKLLPPLYDELNRWGGKANIQSIKFTYNFNWYSPDSWHRSIYIVTDNFFVHHPNTTMDMLRHSPSHKINNIFIAGAWHCSSCLTIDAIITKVESFSHQEINIEKYKERQKIRRDIESGLDMLGRKDNNFRSLPYSGNEGYPDLKSCPQCIDVPGYNDILGLVNVSIRAEKRNFDPNYSVTQQKAIQVHNAKIGVFFNK